MAKILVFGDSVAYGKWDSQGGWVARLRAEIDKRYNRPNGENNSQVYNLGVPGETVGTLLGRFEQELKPRIDDSAKNVIILSVGLNDSCPNNRQTSKQTAESEFKESWRTLIKQAIASGSRLVVMGLTPVSPEKTISLQFTNPEVKRYDGYIKEVCDELGAIRLDLFDDLIKENFGKILVDSVHPNDEGHEILFKRVWDFLDKNKLIDYCVM